MEISLNISQKNGPSEQLIIEDLEKTLWAKGNNLKLNSAETVKSLTEQEIFRITIHAMAKNNYADCDCELELLYSMYDQGWMLDKAVWNYAEYEQKRIPQLDEMKVYAEEYIRSNKICSEAWYYDTMIQFNAPQMEYGYAQELKDDALILKWTGIAQEMYATREDSFRSYWQYKPEIDNWVLCESEEAIYGVHMYYNEGSIEPDYTMDFTGVWKYDLLQTEIKIENFTWDGFDATIFWNEKNSTGEIVRKSFSGRFKKITDIEDLTKPLPSSKCVFATGNGQYVGFIYGRGHVQITSLVQYDHYGKQEDLLVVVRIEK